MRRLRIRQLKFDAHEVTHQLTKCSDNLRLQLVLALEAARNVGNVTATIVSSIWHIANRVKHVTRGVNQDEADAEESQDLAVGNDGLDIRPDRDQCSDDANNGDDSSDDLEPFGRPVDRRVGPAGCLASDPRLNRLCGRFSVYKVRLCKFASNPVGL